MVVEAPYLGRHIDAHLSRLIDEVPAVLIDGPRGVGKTTTALRVARSSIRLPHDQAKLDHNPAQLLSELEPPVLIDEWQLAGIDLLWTVKELVDRDPTPGRFILTGSVEPATYGPTFPLTGRVFPLVMFPLTQAELAGHGSETTLLDRILGARDLADVFDQGTYRGRAFDLETLLRTGFPAGRSLDDPTLFLDGYAAIVAQRAGDEGRDATRLLSTMQVLAVLEAQVVPGQRIWKAADINKATWKAYEDLLARTHLSGAVPAFGSNRLKRLTATKKRHFVDCALAIALAGVDRTRLSADPQVASPYFASFVAQQLRPMVALRGGSLMHLRTSGGEQEVDLVIEHRQNVWGVEVKLGSQPNPADARHLRWMRDQLGDRFRAGIIVHTGVDAYPIDDRVWAVPATAFGEATGVGGLSKPAISTD